MGNIGSLRHVGITSTRREHQAGKLLIFGMSPHTHCIKTDTHCFPISLH